MISFGNEDLKDAPPIPESLTCPHCGKQHEVFYGKKVLPDGTTVPSYSLAAYRCGDNTYLCGINRKFIGAGGAE